MWFWLFWTNFIILIFLLLYIRWILKFIESSKEEIDNISNIIFDFKSHLDSVHELEMFYGDQTLQQLMEHSNQVIEDLSNIDFIINEGEEDKGEDVREEKVIEKKEKE